MRQKNKIHPFFDLNYPVISGHRGAAGIRPENTRASFTAALEQGADILESDLHLSADGIPVLCHDPYIDRVTNGTGAIDEMTLAEIKKWDAGYWFTRDGEDFPFRGKGERVLSLAEAFEIFPQARFTFDLKSDDPLLVQKALAVIKDFNRAELTLLASFDDMVAKNIDREIKYRKVRAATAAASQAVAQCVITSKLGYMVVPGHVMSLFLPRTAGRDAGYGFPTLITRRLCRHAARHNLPVFAWTIDNPAVMEKLLQIGVDGIVTNYPGRALPLVRAARRERVAFTDEKGPRAEESAA